ncbi:MAG: single-stranded DNA-binding protein [Lachnospiraceae bacterium]|nr:single-stranded DNA-binding protein [Lachnospiraceae bacterium]
MNKVILMGRLTRDPEMRYGGASNTGIARFGIAVDRRFKREGQPEADFFNCVAFGRLAEFTEKYLHKGIKILLEGEVQNDNYTNKEGRMVYGIQIVANNIEFAESKNAQSTGGNFGQAGGYGQGGYNPSGGYGQTGGYNQSGGGFAPAGGDNFEQGSAMLDLGDDDGFMNIDEGISEEGTLFGE